MLWQGTVAVLGLLLLVVVMMVMVHARLRLGRGGALAGPARRPPVPWPGRGLGLPLVLAELQVGAPAAAGPRALLGLLECRILPALRSLCGAVPALREPPLAQEAVLRLGPAGLSAGLPRGLAIAVLVALLRSSVLGGWLRLVGGRDKQAGLELTRGIVTG